MDKRLRKRHERKVARAKNHATQSQPDLRTPEQIQAARLAGRPAGGWRNAASVHRAPPAQPAPATPAGPTPEAES